MKNRQIFIPMAVLFACATSANAEIAVVIGHNGNANSTPAFTFAHVPPPAKAATVGKFTIVDGEADGNSGELDKLNDGSMPTEEDQPDENFFFNAGTDGGRLRLDLKAPKPVQQINTYSWHAGSRAPQVYKVYGASGDAAGFNATPKRGADPVACGWSLIASVDTRPKDGDQGGQYGVNISDSEGRIGSYRYILFDCSATEKEDGFGNTFYSEINVLGPGEAVAAGSASASGTNIEVKPFIAHTPDGKYQIVFDTARSPELTEWATNKLAPVLLEWYPKIVAYFPSDGFTAPTNFTVQMRPGRGVADTAGTHVNVYTAWVKREMNGQAIGSVVHECVHVVQQYGNARRRNPDAMRNPGYFVEGVADYYRFFKFEPQTKGAEIRKRGLETANYNRSYRVTANYLNWVAEKYDKNLVPTLNAAMREGNYSTNFWTKATGKSIESLNDEWKSELKKKIESSEGAGT